MATRMDPIWVLPCSCAASSSRYDGKLGALEVGRWRFACGRSCGSCWGGRGGGRTLGLDQLGEPAHLTFGGLQTMTLQLDGVEIESLSALGCCGPEGVKSFLQSAAAAF